jgi:hypothetical protein
MMIKVNGKEECVVTLCVCGEDCNTLSWCFLVVGVVVVSLSGIIRSTDSGREQSKILRNAICN